MRCIAIPTWIWTINKPHLVLKRQVLASFPGHSQILSRSCGENSTELRDKIWEWPGNEARQVQLWVIHCTGHVPTKTLVPYTTAMLDMSRAQEVMDVTKLDLGYISHTHVQYKPVIFTGNHSKLSVNNLLSTVCYYRLWTVLNESQLVVAQFNKAQPTSEGVSTSMYAEIHHLHTSLLMTKTAGMCAC